MNQHLLNGNEALRAGDDLRAVSEFLVAMEDADPLVQRIAKNRLYELHPPQVYASPQSYQRLYHRLSCPAKNRMYKCNFTLYKDWKDAEVAGFRPCHQCKPTQVEPYVY